MLTALCSCMGNASYMTFRPIAGKGWSHMDTLVYPVDTLGSSGTYGMQLLLHTESYPYKNIALGIVVKQDSTILLDTIASFHLAKQPVTKGIGCRNDYILPIGNVALCDTLSTTILLTHCMADTELSGIREVGVEIDEPIGKSEEIVWWVEW